MKKATQAATPTVAAATVSTANPAIAHIAQSPIEHSAPVRKYGATAASVPCAGKLFKLATGDGVKYAAQGHGKQGKPTIQALVCYCARLAGATDSQGANGLAIVVEMQSNADVLAAYGNTKAGQYAPRGTVPCAQWCSEYVTGNARVGLLTRA